MEAFAAGRDEAPTPGASSSLPAMSTKPRAGIVAESPWSNKAGRFAPKDAANDDAD